jgi:hypothetical protein
LKSEISVQKSFLARLYSLKGALLFSAVTKISVFLIGAVIIGITLPRTSIVPTSLPPVFSFDYWPHVEAYTDYRDLYLIDLIVPFLQGHNIYYLGTIVYNYPPLFIYLIGGLGSLVNLAWFPALPLVIFDILTAVPIYLIAKEFIFHGDSRLSFVVAMIWSLNPINLFYNDLMWLNPGPTTFFLILSLYFFLKKNWFLSSLSLAISTGFKQVSIVFLPILLILLWRALGFSRKLFLYIFTYVVSMILISIPYILPSYSNGQWNLTSAQNYFWSLNFPILGYPSNVTNSPPTFSISLSEPVRLTFFIGMIRSVQLQDLAAATYLYLNYVLAVAYAALLVVVFFKSRKSSFLTWNGVFIFCMSALLIFLAFFGRGVYKYYFATLTPLALPLFTTKKTAILFEIFSLGLILVPREATPWFALLLLTLLPMVYSVNHREFVREPLATYQDAAGSRLEKIE